MLLASSDDSVVTVTRDVVKRWGGDFWIKDGVDWKKEIKKWRQAGGKVLHLTMYGANLPSVIDSIRAERLMVVVGAEKVPPELYTLADYNVAITNQPHSEIAALSILLDRLQSGQELDIEFDGKHKIKGNVHCKGVRKYGKVS